MIKLYQLLYFLLFINIKLPSNATQFISSFKKNILDYIPQLINIGAVQSSQDAQSESRQIRILFQRSLQVGAVRSTEAPPFTYNTDQDSINFCTPHLKFDENGLTCDVFTNIGSYISQVLIIFSIKLILLLAVRLLQKKGEKQKERRKERESCSIDKLENTKIEQFSQRKRKTQNSFQKKRAEEKEKKDKEERKDSLNNNKPKEKKQFSFKNLVLKVNKKLDIAFLFNLTKAMELKAVMGAMVSLKSDGFYSRTGKFNFTTAMAVLIFYLGLIFVVSYLSYYMYKGLLSNPKKFKPDPHCEDYLKALKLYKEVKELGKENRSTSFVTALMILHDLVIPIALVAFINSPYAQILTLMIVLAVVLYQMIKQRPFIKKQKNAAEIVNKLLFLVILIVFLISHTSRKSMSEKNKFEYIGTTLIVLVSLLMLSSFVIGIWGIIEGIFTSLKKRREQKKVKQKEKTINQDESVDKSMVEGVDFRK